MGSTRDKLKMNTTIYEITIDDSVLHLLSYSIQNRNRGHHITKREEGTGRSCSDPLSFASFLAFALAVANLMMNGGGKRRKRETASCFDESMYKNLTLSTSIVMNEIISEKEWADRSCWQLNLCKVGKKLSTLGKTGQLIGRGTRLLGEETSQFIELGISGDCKSLLCLSHHNFNNPPRSTVP